MITDLGDAVLWVGSGYAKSSSRLLLLGESWYGEDDHLTQYIDRWIAKEQRDYLFSRIFNALSGYHTRSASQEQRKLFWADIAFYNFVSQSVGDTREDRPNPKHYRDAQEPLKHLLRALQPGYAIVMGKGQAEFSKPVIDAIGVSCSVVSHPTSLDPSRIEQLQVAWGKAKSAGTGRIGRE